ncbi:endonuclease V-like [Protopterus annectens]|uniref:endonuclease V-like n=1 Tax=Protopterus annectens TaxID=7888 RepID=UPI001CFB9E4F|nr:endonuclease V-like [Protopterus annectens]
MAEACQQTVLQKWERKQRKLKNLMIDSDTEEWQRSESFLGLGKIGGVDLSFIKEDNINACASLVILSYPDLQVIYEDYQMVRLTAPYIAGFLAFREAPYLVEAVDRLRKQDPSLVPQVILVDGNGLLHYRGKTAIVLTVCAF